jgi:pyruvate kinase
VQVFKEVEDWVAKEKFGVMKLPAIAQGEDARVSEELCTAAANLAGQLGVAAILVYTRTGSTAGFVSRRRPDCPVLAITGVPHPPP